MVSLIGGILFIFAFAAVLIDTPLFASLAESPSAAVGLRRESGGINWSWWGTAVMFVAIPLLTFFPFQGFIRHLPTNAWLSQNLTTGFMLWAVGNGLISIILFSLWHFVLGGKKNGGNGQGYGLTWTQSVTAKKILLTLGLAIAIIAGLYSVLWLNHSFFIADFRWWVFALKLMNSLQFCIFLGYVIPFTLFFITVGVSLHGQLRDKDSLSLTRAILRNATLMGLGMAILLAYQYIPLFMGNTLSIPAQSLLTIVAIQFLGLLPMVGLISTYFFHKTGHVYLGAFVNGLLLTWWIVAGQATHYAF